MRTPSEKTLERLRKEYPAGTRVELVQMDNDPQAPPAGTRGTVVWVDDAADLIVDWDDNVSGLNVVLGVDVVRKL